jgi:hypothetical protein
MGNQSGCVYDAGFTEASVAATTTGFNTCQMRFPLGDYFAAPVAIILEVTLGVEEEGVFHISPPGG